jgi:hypothetical protein
MARVRVHDLAKELPSACILTWLKELGHFVKSAASTVEPPVVQALMAAYERGELRVARPTSKPRPGGNPFRPRPHADKNLIDAAAMFGVPVEDLKPARAERPGKRGRYASAESRRPIDEWTNLLFSVDEKREWMLAGLDEHDSRLAQQCIDAGLTPDDLQRRVDGVKVAARLRGGESLSSVRIRIQQQQNRSTGTD